MRRAVSAFLLATASVSLLAGCATTIESDSATSSTTPASTTTTIPRGTVPELFGAILALGGGLGNDIASGEMQTARAKLADIRATWQAITPQIADLGKDVNDDLQRLVTLYSTAVERKRPADADKATRYLNLAIEPIIAAG
ncbi:MAG: hypothetical protein KGQ43_06790 [Acidobacteria bacterium]|nr:hypothetical protein [Acidobacteriota bacterium]